MITGNKGEWSEIYTLFKLIADKKLYAGDSDLNKIENLIFPIIKILRAESDGTYEYFYHNNLVIITGSEEKFKIPIIQFQEQASTLLTALKTSTNTTFSLPQIESFLNSFNCHSLKARSSVKSDIRIVIHDQRTGTNPELGFSIKSQLGSASTLLNAGKTTNFIFNIENTTFKDIEIEEINSIGGRSKIKDRIEKIIEKSGKLTFTKTESSVFGNNLVIIDSLLPNILSKIIYRFFCSKLSNVKDLVTEITESNPLEYDSETNHPFYTYKIKRFLADIALGMMPSKVWTGEFDATGGYLVVKEDGDILCYHIYNKNEFEDYLFNNTKLETASSSKHHFGKIYNENGKTFFKLNLQIRFIK